MTCFREFWSSDFQKTDKITSSMCDKIFSHFRSIKWYLIPQYVLSTDSIKVTNGSDLYLYSEDRHTTGVLLIANQLITVSEHTGKLLAYEHAPILERVPRIHSRNEYALRQLQYYPGAGNFRSGSNYLSLDRSFIVFISTKTFY